LQTLNYFDNGSSFIADADYKNKVIIMMDNVGNVVTASYESDTDPDIKPDDLSSGFPFWIVVLIIILVVLILVIGLMYRFQ
jgi:hypothetical protein